MPIELIDKIKPKNGQGFPMVDAEDVEMPDGTRLSDLTVNYPLAEGASILQPDRYYVFGEVSALSLTLAEADDGKVHEYCFEFIPTDSFTGLNISPEVSWALPCVFTAGAVHQVSIVRRVGVMIRA